MSWDPQNAPDVWVTVVATVTDVEGFDWLVVVDQDGEEWLRDPEDWRP